MSILQLPKTTGSRLQEEHNSVAGAQEAQDRTRPTNQDPFHGMQQSHPAIHPISDLSQLTTPMNLNTSALSPGNLRPAQYAAHHAPQLHIPPWAELPDLHHRDGYQYSPIGSHMANGQILLNQIAGHVFHSPSGRPRIQPADISTLRHSSREDCDRTQMQGVHGITTTHCPEGRKERRQGL